MRIAARTRGKPWWAGLTFFAFSSEQSFSEKTILLSAVFWAKIA
jgi:hypothetical protein